MRTIGHHTCKKDGGKAYVENNSPFFSMYDEDKKKLPFLGAGHYFWDYNKEASIDWGKRHCDNDFYVVECELELVRPYFLDLAGNREDMIHLIKLKEVVEKRLGKECTFIGQLIEMCKRVNVSMPGFYTYTAVRAVDVTRSTGGMKFSENSRYESLLDPLFIICITGKSDTIIKSKRIIAES